MVGGLANLSSTFNFCPDDLIGYFNISKLEQPANIIQIDSLQTEELEVP